MTVISSLFRYKGYKITLYLKAGEPIEFRIDLSESDIRRLHDDLSIDIPRIGELAKEKSIDLLFQAYGGEIKVNSKDVLYGKIKELI
ncbi:hypothetical protein ABH961_005761 [Bacillus sp. RC251]|uniref:hypothetical protein n=1 Tax=Bacillus sp. RC251 TaxID=3156290 RepID=UPI0038369047